MADVRARLPIRILLILGAISTDGNVSAYESLVAAGRRAGFVPLIVGEGIPDADRAALLDLVAAVLIGGSRADDSSERRRASSIPFIQEAAKRRIPVLGFCYGHQTINRAFGGTIGLIPEGREPHVTHRVDIVPRSRNCFHDIVIEPGSRLHKVVGADTLTVNSSHRYEVKEIGEGLRVVARAADGTPEALEHTDLPVTGFQFHPETIGDKGEIFDKLIRTALNGEFF